MVSLESLRKDCYSCRLCQIGGCYEGDKISNVWGRGNPNAKIMFVGLQPTLNEVEAGKPFYGESSQFFNEVLQEELGFTSDDFYLTNLVKCYDRNGKTKRYEIENCSSKFLIDEVKLVNPKVVVALGKHVFKYFHSGGSIAKYHGIEMYSAKINKVVVPMYTPSLATQKVEEFREAFKNDIRGLKKWLTE